MLSFGNVQILDLSSLVAIVGGWGIMPMVLKKLREAFLDRLLQGLTPDEQNRMLQGALILLTAVGVLCVALATGHALSWQTVLSVIVSTAVSARGSHFIYNGLQKSPRVVVQHDEIPPLPPTAQSAALSTPNNRPPTVNKPSKAA